jgi:PilZ domain
MSAGRKLRAYVNIPTQMGTSNIHTLTITNISLSGCFLRTDMWLDVGTRIKLGVPVDDGRVVQIAGMVVRQHDEPKGYGIAFFALPDEARRELALLIAETIE